MTEATVNYVCSERAHFMCPNMHFGIMAQIAAGYDENKVRRSAEALQKAHPFLQSLIAREEETGRLYYQLQKCLNIPIAEKRILIDANGRPAEKTGPSGGALGEREEYHFWQPDYAAISGQGWDVRKECLLKILVYPDKPGFHILFIAHHLLCDGRGLIQLAEEFAQHYVKGVTPPFAQERLIQSLQDLPQNSDLPFISRYIISDANKKWKKERHRVSYEEYAKFEKEYIRQNPIDRKITTVNQGDLEKIQALCRQQEISVNDYLIAEMMRKEDTCKLVIAADIRNQVSCYRQGAMGNYSTAFSVVIKKKEGDIMSLAKRAAAQVSEIMKRPRKEMLVLACYLRMQPELIDAVAISTLGDFDSRAGAFVGKNMFGFGSQNGYSITNLGKIQSEVITEAVFIPPASPANQKTLGVLTVNGTMKICTATAATAIRERN